MTDLKICDRCHGGPAFAASLNLRGRGGEYIVALPIGDWCWRCVTRQCRIEPEHFSWVSLKLCFRCLKATGFPAYINLRDGREYRGFSAIGYLCVECAKGWVRRRI